MSESARVNLAELRTLAGPATPGPWDVDWNGPLTAIHASDGSGKHVAKTATVPDAALIVAARNSLLALVEAVEAALQAERWKGRSLPVYETHDETYQRHADSKALTSALAPFRQDTE